MLYQVRGGVKGQDEISRRGPCVVPGVKWVVGAWKEHQEWTN